MTELVAAHTARLTVDGLTVVIPGIVTVKGLDGAVYVAVIGPTSTCHIFEALDGRNTSITTE